MKGNWLLDRNKWQLLFGGDQRALKIKVWWLKKKKRWLRSCALVVKVGGPEPHIFSNKKQHVQSINIEAHSAHIYKPRFHYISINNHDFIKLRKVTWMTQVIIYFTNFLQNYKSTKSLCLYIQDWSFRKVKLHKESYSQNKSRCKHTLSPSPPPPQPPGWKRKKT